MWVRGNGWKGFWIFVREGSEYECIVDQML